MRRGIAIALAAAGLALGVVPSARAWTTLVNGTLPGFAAGTAVAVDAFGNVFVGGLVTSVDGQTSVVLKLSGTTEVWRRVGSGDSVGETIVALAVLPGGDVIVGSVVGVAGEKGDWVVTRLATDSGAVVWRAAVDGGAGNDDVLHSVAVDDAGDVAVGGTFRDLAGKPEFAVVKLDGATGGELWRYVLPTSDAGDTAYDVKVGFGGDVFACGTHDGFFVVDRLAGATGAVAYDTPVNLGTGRACAIDTFDSAVDAVGEFYHGGDPGLYVAQVDAATGLVAWVYAAVGDAPPADDGTAVAPAGDGSGDVFAAGTLANVATDQDMFVVRLSKFGDVRWSSTIDDGMKSQDFLYSMIVDDAGHPVLAGFFVDATVDAALVRVDPSTGTPEWTDTFDGAAHEDDAFIAAARAGTGDLVATGELGDRVNQELAVLHVRASDGGETSRVLAHGDGFASFDLGTAVARDPNGDVLVGGFTRNVTTDPYSSDQFTVAKLDGRRGTERWRYTSSSDGFVEALAVDAAGNVVAVGETSVARNDPDATVVRLGPDGRLVWIRQLSGGVALGNDRAHAVVLGADGSTYVAGELTRPATGMDLFVAKLAADGTEVWRRTYASPGAVQDSALAIALDAAGDVAVAGEAGEPATWLVMKLAASDGSVMWSTTAAGTHPSFSNVPAAIATDPASRDVVVAGTLAYATTGFDFAAVRFAAADGKELWRALYQSPGTGADEAFAVAIDPGGDVLVGGEFENPATGEDVFVVRLAPDKTQRWAYSTGTADGNDEADAVAFDAAGNAVVSATLAAPAMGRRFALLGLDAATGTEAWRHVVGDGSAPLPPAGSLLVDAGGAIAAVGSVATQRGTDQDIVAVRLAPGGVEAACVKLSPADADCRPCAAGCDDGEPCTADTCDASGFCAWTPVAGDDAATCAFARAFPPAACAGQHVPRAFAKLYRHAGVLVKRGLAAKSAKKTGRALRRASSLLGRLLSLVDKATHRRHRPLATACADAIRALVQDAKARVDARRGG